MTDCTSVLDKYNGFANLLEMVDFYYNLSLSDDKNKLLHYTYLNDDTSFIYPLTIINSINDANEEDNDSWLNFDETNMNRLLNENFFSEYVNTVYHDSIKSKSRDDSIEPPCITGKRKYPFIEIYAFHKLQSIVISKFNDDELENIWFDWCINDTIDAHIWSCHWYNIISDVYVSKGKNWFYKYQEGLDALLYKWACYGIASCKKTGKLNDTVLKNDLIDLHSELLIKCVRTESLDDNNDILTYLQDCISNFNTEDIAKLNEKLSSLKHENIMLSNDKEILNKSINVLKEQIFKLEMDKDRSDAEKTEAIAKRIYAMMPEEHGKENKSSHEFTEIWSRLSKETKEDINRSVRFFEEIESVDVAIFLMIRNIEREFAQNFFKPFHNSSSFTKIKDSFCTDNRYSRTHAMLNNTEEYPTMGSIPFIGRAVANRKAIDSSKVIQGFASFLGDSKQPFIEICKSIDSYKIGVKKNKIVDIRNIFAHGNEDNIEAYDKSSYNDLSHLLYEPPLKILFRIIKNSKKIKQQ